MFTMQDIKHLGSTHRTNPKTLPTDKSHAAADKQQLNFSIFSCNNYDFYFATTLPTQSANESEPVDFNFTLPSLNLMY